VYILIIYYYYFISFVIVEPSVVAGIHQLC